MFARRFLVVFSVAALVACIPKSAVVPNGPPPVCGYFGPDCHDGTCCDEGYLCPGPMAPPGSDCEAGDSNGRDGAKRRHRHAVPSPPKSALREQRPTFYVARNTRQP